MPGPKPALIVSPHPDDAVLSCWALLAKPEPVEVLDVFAGSPDPPRRGAWDLRCGFRDSAESSRARREEELRALEGTPHRPTFLELVNADYIDGPRSPTTSTGHGRRATARRSSPRFAAGSSGQAVAPSSSRPERAGG